MYVPAHFLEQDREKLQSLIEENSFATLVTAPTSEPPFVSHLPFLLDRTRGDYGVLRAHMARANPQWRHFQPEREVLACFSGPHAYISPAWYAEGDHVPTWNYVAAHAYGVPKIIDEDLAVARMLEDLVTAQERHAAQPWTLEGVPDEFLKGLRNGIVAFEIPITRLEGKYKIGQNRTQPDRDGAIAALSKSPDPSARRIAELMRTVSD